MTKLSKRLYVNDEGEITSRSHWREEFERASNPQDPKTTHCANCNGFMIKREDRDLCEKCETGK